jgi:hypothetical protein
MLIGSVKFHIDCGATGGWLYLFLLKESSKGCRCHPWRGSVFIEVRTF